MSPNGHQATLTTSSVINLILGAWLFISAWAIGSTTAGVMWNNVLCGAAIFILATIRLSGRSRAGVPSWLNALLGIWVIISPFVLKGSMAQSWNCVITGAIVVIFGLTSASAAAPRHA
ncbi:MAG TPA: SPW repeat protein [Opitutus sp.]|nr:SPW repeat protein [Opitutus sp.]